MYKITWDEETGGVLLNTTMVSGTLGISPRPVFFEELDLIGLDKLGWSYPRCAEPIMWAVNKQYWYRGQHLFDAKGANIYTKPTLEMMSGVIPMALQAVDVEAMLERTKELMSALESEAIYFIRETFDTYSRANKTYAKAEANKLDFDAMAERAGKKTGKKMVTVRQDCDSFDVMPLSEAERQGKRVLLTTKIDRFIASFSGGKDSQVVLDLCTRAIPPSDFEVIYSDTGYELPPSLELYEQVQEHYHKLYPSLKFHTARNHESVLNYWDKIGTPSDTHRWCCSIMKTAPLYRMLKVDGNKQARVLTFDGVRAEESTRRSGYERIGKGVKHGTVINASPILYWSSVEIFLYLFRNNIDINIAYRYGITRVGCIICPFSSEWNDMLINQIYHKELQPFLSRIENTVTSNGVLDSINYIKEGNWKRRAGGRDTHTDSAIDIINTNSAVKFILDSPKQDPILWLRAIGKYVSTENHGELNYKGEIYPYTVRKEGNTFIIDFANTYNKFTLQGLIKRALYKSTFCINCEACEVECPTGALSILPVVSIDPRKCVHCNKCLTFHETGCLVAHSLKITESKSEKMDIFNNDNVVQRLTSYNNFGLREEWFDFFMRNHVTYFSNTEHGLNIKEQLPIFVKWLIQGEIISDAKSRKITKLGEILIETYKKSPELVWQILWVNLTYNSPIAHWYSYNVDKDSILTDSDFREGVKQVFTKDSPTTVKNVVYAMCRTFNESPIGNQLGQYEKIDKASFTRKGSSDVKAETIAYSLYKYAQAKRTNIIRVSDLYRESEEYGIYREFCIPKTEFEKKLRYLSSCQDRVIIAELNMGLEHITLRDDLNIVDVLQKLAL
ncbi:MAG: phosphoadenosine phosphosulfate reductase family protein [Bacteroidales bacterium]|nr:phosphoadenosine phosphosulfate reductase family protein [Bacteroidales bacterium]